MLAREGYKLWIPCSTGQRANIRILGVVDPGIPRSQGPVWTSAVYCVSIGVLCNPNGPDMVVVDHGEVRCRFTGRHGYCKKISVNAKVFSFVDGRVRGAHQLNWGA